MTDGYIRDLILTPSDNALGVAKQFKKAKPHYDDVPTDTIETLLNYLWHGYHPGGFVEAVLCNRLVESFSHADLRNQQAMASIVAFVYNYLPGGTWGSITVMNDHIARVHAALK